MAHAHEHEPPAASSSELQLDKAGRASYRDSTACPYPRRHMDLQQVLWYTCSRHAVKFLFAVVNLKHPGILVIHPAFDAT
jgi:hypothetical protein